MLFEEPNLPAFELPNELSIAYGGTIGFTAPRVYANFVESLDGVTALPGIHESGRLIAGGSEHDRFVMGLLRAFADVVLIGAGTLYGSPQTHWTPAHAYPPAAAFYANTRKQRGLPPVPTLAVFTGSGAINPHHPGLTEPSLVLTSEYGAKRLEGRLPSSAQIAVIGDRSPLDVSAMVNALRARGHALILCEGGPTLFGALVESNLVDELFVTLSPELAGRTPEPRSLSLVENVALLPGRSIVPKLLSVRRGGSHLFLRYEFQPYRAV